MKFHIVYKPSGENTFSTGINVTAEDEIQALIDFRNQVGQDAVFLYIASEEMFNLK